MSEHVEVSTVICHILCIENIKIVILTMHTRKQINDRLPRIAVLFQRHLYFHQELFIWRGLTQTCYFISESRRNLRESFLAEHSFMKTVTLHTHGIHDIQTELQFMVTMDCTHPSYSAATTVTVETETCRLVSHGRIAGTCAYSLPFCSHASSFTIARTHCSVCLLYCLWCAHTYTS